MKQYFLNLFTIISYNFYFGILNVYANANVFVNKYLYISDVGLYYCFWSLVDIHVYVFLKGTLQWFYTYN